MKTILEVEVGSTAHGTGTGSDDLDLMRVVIEDADTFVGFHDQDTWVERTKPEGVRSEPGDVDLVTYGLRKYLRLALKGNPSVLLALFIPNGPLTRVCTPEGYGLSGLSQFLVAKTVFGPYRGYMEQQKQLLLGKRGQMRVHRPELVEEFGYDTKYAGHILRLGFQGEELLSTGRLTIPMPEKQRDAVIECRRGEMDRDWALAEITESQKRLKEAFLQSPLPETPNRSAVEAWMVQTYLDNWRRD